MAGLTGREIDKLHDAQAYLSKNLDRRISRLNLSREIGMNQTHLKAGFKQLFGTTIFDYTLELKMKLAAELLQENRLSISEISDLTGYSHPNHFSTAFKRKYGVSPGSFT